MEMHQIRYFLAVAESLNFTRAAEQCHVAQPSLSRAIGKLEEELGGDLFRRERGQSHLTELGRSMLPLLRQSYECANAAKTQAASYGSAKYAPLALGLSMTIDLELFAPALAELARGYSGLALRLARGPSTAVLEALKAGDIELGLVADDSAEWERFDCWPLFEEDFVVLCSHRHAFAESDRTRTTLSQLVGQTVIVRPYCESAAAFAAELEARELRLASVHEAANDADARTMAHHGVGIGLLPRSAVGGEDGMPLTDFDMKRTLYVYAVAGRQRSAAAATFLSLLRAADWSVASHTGP